MLHSVRHILFACAAFVAVWAQAGSLTVEHIVESRGMHSAALSPDGRHLATIENAGMNLGIFLMDTSTGVRKVIGQGVAYFNLDSRLGTYRFPKAVRWVTNDLIAVNYGSEAESIDLDGERVAGLGVEVIGKTEPGNADSPMLLVYEKESGKGFASINARTGKSKTIDLPGGGELLHWALDAQGVVRAVTMSEPGSRSSEAKMSNWYRKSSDGAWEKLAEFSGAADIWRALEVPEQAGNLVVLSRAGRDTFAIFNYDINKRELNELVAGHPTQDIVETDGRISEGTGSIVTRGMKRERIWLDARWHAAQQAVDAALPGRFNAISSNPATFLLIWSQSDQDPGSWHLADVKKSTVGLVGRVISSLEGVDMAPMEAMMYKARDGLNIPAYLTRPAGKSGPRPLVVMVHNGPAMRDGWIWNRKVQWLAAHGYAVFQPQFRGSSGFGRKFQMAGGEWGLAMQDDVTDGVRQLISLGIADPGRICIAGEGYGGYAALWGLVQTPELYRCGVSDGGMLVLQPAFNSVSPLKHAAAIRAPILLIHDAADKQVPISHSRNMKAALDAAGKPYEWFEFDSHDFPTDRIANEYKYYAQLLAFLDKHIGTGRESEAAHSVRAGGK